MIDDVLGGVVLIVEVPLVEIFVVDGFVVTVGVVE